MNLQEFIQMNNLKSMRDIKRKSMENGSTLQIHGKLRIAIMQKNQNQKKPGLISST